MKRRSFLGILASVPVAASLGMSKRSMADYKRNAEIRQALDEKYQVQAPGDRLLHPDEVARRAHAILAKHLA